MTEKDAEVGAAIVPDAKETAVDKDQDDSMVIFAGAGVGEVFGYSDGEARTVRWKLDLILLPMVSSPRKTLLSGYDLLTNKCRCV